MYGFRRGSGGAGGSGNVSTLGGGANGRITLWNGPTTVTGDASGTWAGTGHTFVVGSPTFNASDGHFTGPAGASFGPSSVGGGFTNQPAGDTVTFVSDDAGDTTQQVTIIGVLAGVDASENLLLHGVNPVTSVGTYDLVLALVLNNACAGTVTASETSGGLTITTIAPAALSAGLQTFASIDGYGKVLQIVASGATTKTVGIGGYALGGGIQREPVVLTGTTKVNTTATWEGAVQFYLGDLEATRTVTLNSIRGFDFSPGLISLGTQQDTFISRASAGLLLVEDGSGSPRDVQARTVFANTLGPPSAGPMYVATSGGGPGWYFGAIGVAYAIAPDSDNVADIGYTPGYRVRTGYFGTSVVTPVVSSVGDTTLDAWTNGSVRWQFGRSADGYAFYPYTNNTYDIGYAGTNTVRTGYFGTSLYAPLLSAATAASGTNTSGINLTIQPQAPTGNATPTSLVFKTPSVGASGTTAQTQTTRLTISEAASIWGRSTDGKYPLAVSGTTKGFRVETTAGETTIMGVDSTLAGSYEPLIVGGSTISIYTNGTTAAAVFDASQHATFYGPVRLKGYTVATLPAGTVGDTAYCTDLTAPTFMAVAVGGGAVVGKVFYDGTNWITQ